VLTCSALLAVYLAVSGGFTVFGDSWSYFQYADGLSRARFAEPLYVRTPGYPLLILLSGYEITRSPLGLVMIQAVLCALIPWLAHRSFSIFSERMGLAAGTVSLLSLTPFLFQNMLFPDAAYLFFAVLTIYCLTRVFAGKPEYVYYCFAAAAFAQFIRPAGIALVTAYAILIPLIRRRLIKETLLSLVIVAGLSIGFRQFENLSFRHFQNISVTGTFAGRQLFLNAYLRSAPYGGFDVKSTAMNGLKRDIETFLATDPRLRDNTFGLSPHEYQDLFGQYKRDPERLTERIFGRPDIRYNTLLFGLGDIGSGGDRQFRRLWLEYVSLHPFIVARYVAENFVGQSVGEGWSYGAGVYPESKAVENDAPFWPLSQNVATGAIDQSAVGASFLESRTPSHDWFANALLRLWSIEWSVGRPLFYALMIAGWIASFWESQPIRNTMTATVGVGVANTLLLSLLVDPKPRYQAEGMVIAAFVAGAAAWIILRRGRAIVRPNLLQMSPFQRKA
jgi:hypothetical protein